MNSIRKFGTTMGLKSLPLVDDAYKRTTVQNLLSLKSKTTVITGGGRGIGLAIVRGCVEAGGNVAVLDALPGPHSDYDELVKAYPTSQVKYYQTDVANFNKLEVTFKQVIDDFGQIDSCVTAAGIVLDKPFLEHEWEETLKVQMVNVSTKNQSLKTMTKLHRLWERSLQLNLLPGKW